MTVATEAKPSIDIEVFEDLWRKFELRLSNYANRKTNRYQTTAEDLKDLIQQTRIKAFGAFDQFDRTRSFEAWVTRIFQNLFLDHLRRQKSRPASISLGQNFLTETGQAGWEFPREIADSGSDPERLLLDGCLSEELSNAFGRLSPEHRLTLMLMSDGLSYEEIGREMRVELGTVRSRIHRARKLMQQFLKGRSDRRHFPNPRTR